MKLLQRIVVIAAVSWTSSSNAATFSALVFGSCTSSGTTSAGCLTATGSEVSGTSTIDARVRSEAGDLGVAAGSFRAYDESGDQVADYSNSVSGSVIDTLQFSVDTGTLTISTKFSATIEQLIVDPGQPTPSSASVSYRVSAGSQTFGRSLESYVSASRTEFRGSGSTVDQWTFSFRNGQLILNYTMASSARCGDLSNIFGQFNFCWIQTNGMQSLRLYGAVVRDMNGDVVVGGLIGSSSGYDYSADLNALPSVPLPSSAFFLMTSVLLLRKFRL